MPTRKKEAFPLIRVDSLGILLGLFFLLHSISFAVPPEASKSSLERWILKPQSRLYLEGSSTLHLFSSTATKMGLLSNLTVPHNQKAIGDIAQLFNKDQLDKFELTIPVKSLKSGKKGLDKNLYEALRADSSPQIVFRLIDYQVEPSSIAQAVFQIKAKGQLFVAGKENAIDLDVAISTSAQGLRVSGSKALLMTDFDVKPPTMMLGALKTDNKVVIRFDLLLGLEQVNEEKKGVR